MCICCRFEVKTEAQVIFLNPVTDCSSCKQEFVLCPFVYEETNGSYPLVVATHNAFKEPEHLQIAFSTCRKLKTETNLK